MTPDRTMPAGGLSLSIARTFSDTVATKFGFCIRARLTIEEYKEHDLQNIGHRQYVLWILLGYSRRLFSYEKGNLGASQLVK